MTFSERSKLLADLHTEKFHLQDLFARCVEIGKETESIQENLNFAINEIKEAIEEIQGEKPDRLSGG